MNGFDDLDYQSFSNKVLAKCNIKLADYKQDQMRRRLQSLCEKNGANSFMGFFALMDRDRNVLEAFLDHMTINVTELFRNPELFKTLQVEIIPDLVKTGVKPFQAWSAGCSYGAEAYTMGVILSELIPTMDFRIKGTDLDLAIIARANNPQFSVMDMQSVTPARKDKHFLTLDERSYQPIGAMKRCITFSPHDLLVDPYPTNQYDLILCRNVVIYFNDDAKSRIFRGFFQALRPGGVLFLGGTERLADHSGVGFELMRPFFYKKPESAVRRLAA